MKTRIEQNEPNDPHRRHNHNPDEAGGRPGSKPAEHRVEHLRGFVRRYELVIFFALSYLIAWSTLPFGSFSPLRRSCRRSSSS